MVQYYNLYHIYICYHWQSALCCHWTPNFFLVKKKPFYKAIWISVFGVPGTYKHVLNTLRPRQDGRYFADDVLKCIFLNENVWISLKIPLKVVPRGPINNIPALVQIMAWRRPGNKPLSEPMLVFVPTHICVTRPQWVKACATCSNLIKELVQSLGKPPKISIILQLNLGKVL